MDHDNFGGQTAMKMQLKTPSVGPLQTDGAAHSDDAHVQLTVPTHFAGIVTQL